MNKSTPVFEELDFQRTESQPFNLKGFILSYIRYWYLFVIFLGLCYLGAKLYLRYTIPQYEVKSAILIKSPQSNDQFDQQLILRDLGLGGQESNVNDEIQILKSVTLMEEVVDKLNLNISFITEGRIRNNNIYVTSPITIDSIKLDSNKTGSFIIQILNDQEFIKTEKGQTTTERFNVPFFSSLGYFTFVRNRQSFNPNQPITVAVRKREATAKAYASRISIRRARDYSNVLELKLRDNIPEKAADILNTLVEVYNEATIEDQNRVTKNTIKFIDDRLRYLTTELDSVETSVESYKKRNELTTGLSQDIEMVFTELSKLNGEIASLEMNRSVIDAMENHISNEVNQFELIPANLSLNNPALNSKIEEHNQLVLERDRKLKSASESNPIVIEATEKINALRPIILSSINNLKADLEKNINRAYNNQQLVQKKVRSFPTKEKELLDITRQQSVKEALYVYLLQRREETALSEAATVAGSRIIDEARPNRSPISPKSNDIFMIAFALGLGIPVGLIVLKDLLNDKILSEKDIQTFTKTPILGGINFSKKGENIVVKKNSRSSTAEMFRLLRTNLQFLSGQKEKQTILITSGTSGEGKSFITINLGISIAISNKKTVIIGLDLRKPKLSKYLNLEKDSKMRGMTNYLVGKAEKSEIIYETGLHENLYYIPSGPMPPNPAELINTNTLDQLFAELQEEFDYILIDTPPVGLVTDALLLNRFADISLYVIRYGVTKKGTVNLIEELYQQEKLTNPAIIYNGIKRQGGYGYGYGGYSYGYGYGYGYGYSYGYYDDEKRPWWKKLFARK